MDPAEVISRLKKLQAGGEIPDICILDIEMPGISGFELARRIRKQDAPIGEIPLLAFSSTFLTRSSNFREVGFNGFLPKPIRRKKLIKMVERLIGLKQEVGKDIAKSDVLITQHSIVEATKHSLHILIAEDNPINMKLARFILEKAGYQVTAAVNGKEAVEIYTRAPSSYDLILMDIQMPLMDGRKATRKIREKGFSHVPIIAMTAEAMKGDREKCIAAGMDDYLSKPLKREDIYQMVKKWCLEK
jgi:CheY-like chemotaxis protein